MPLIDAIFVALVIGAYAAEHAHSQRLIRSSLPTYGRRTRRRVSWGVMAAAWTMTLIGTAIWIHEQRPWDAMKFNFPDGWRAWASLAGVTLVAIWQWWSVRMVATSPKWRTKVTAQVEHLGSIRAILPTRRDELPLFTGVALTAGICEEFLFRGYLIWAFQQATGWRLAVALSLALFALGHAYQGFRGVLQSAVAGAVMTLLVALFDSLIPAMVIHALLDLGGGYMMYVASRDQSPAGHAGEHARETS